MATTLIENFKKVKSETFVILMVSKLKKNICMEILKYVNLCYFKYFSNVSYVIITWIL